MRVVSAMFIAFDIKGKKKKCHFRAPVHFECHVFITYRSSEILRKLLQRAVRRLYNTAFVVVIGVHNICDKNKILKLS